MSAMRGIERKRVLLVLEYKESPMGYNVMLYLPIVCIRSFYDTKDRIGSWINNFWVNLFQTEQTFFFLFNKFTVINYVVNFLMSKN